MKFYLIATFAFISTWLLFVPTAQSQVQSQTQSETQSELPAQEMVRVRLKSAQEEILLSGTALRVQGINEAFVKVAIPQKETLRVRRFEKAGHFFWLVSRSQHARSQIISEEFLSIEGQDIKLNAQNLPRKILLSAAGKKPAERKNMDLIAVVPLDEYVAGVIASEMPLSWPLETLKAQAVASRSYALAMMRERKNKTYHVESSILDQVFRHLIARDGDALLQKALRAVSETKSVQMVGAKGKTLKAFYHSDCGGKTASARNVWNTSFSAGEAVDESCPLNPNAHWRFSLSREILYAKLKKFLALDKESSVQSLQFIPIAGDERVQSVTVQLSDGKTLKVNGNDFRALVGFQDLRSTLFNVQEMDGNFVFVGRGFGHGVGLCQWGSRTLGLQGRKYQEILKHYYPLAQLVTRN